MKSMVVWDYSEPPPTNQQVFLWNRYTEKDGQRSILKTLEDNSDQLRSDYLALMYELGQIFVRGKRIVEHLMIEPGFSLWWMSLLAEKGIPKTKAPLNCLKLLALKNLLVEIKPKTIELKSKNRVLAQSLCQLSGSLGISFKWSKPLNNQYPFTLSYIWKKLPHVLQAPIFFARNLYLYWFLRKARDTKWYRGDDAIFIFSYFLNLNRDALNNGKFVSKYWDTLPRLINRSRKNINWFHHFMLSDDVPDTKTGIKYLQTFNEDAINQGRHNFLYSFLTIDIIAKTISIWFRTTFNTAIKQRDFDKQILRLSQGWLWPLLRDDWKSSVYGKVAIQNILWAQLFDRAMFSLPKQNLGLYLLENQGWERAFIYYWKKYGHGPLFGVAHSMVRYWDLRYFDDPQVWQSKDAFAQPLPDKIALNGPAAFNSYIKANQPKSRLVEVEAMRYQYLNHLKHKANSFVVDCDQKKLLIIGDYLSETNHKMLRLFDCFEKSDLVNFKLLFKPHPATKISLDNYKSLNIHVTSLSLNKLLPEVNLVISTGSTVGAVEPLFFGIPVIVCLEDDNFNFSPLRGEKGVSFVRTGDGLKTAFVNLNSKSYNSNNKNGNQPSFFWIDPNLPRWKALLGLNQKQKAEDIYTSY